MYGGFVASGCDKSPIITSRGSSRGVAGCGEASRVAATRVFSTSERRACFFFPNRMLSVPPHLSLSPTVVSSSNRRENQQRSRVPRHQLGVAHRSRFRHLVHLGHPLEGVARPLLHGDDLDARGRGGGGPRTERAGPRGSRGGVAPLESATPRRRVRVRVSGGGGAGAGGLRCFATLIRRAGDNDPGNITETMEKCVRASR